MAFATVDQQKKLKPRSAPYWHRLAAGQHLGFRKTATSCTWLARAYDPATQKQVKRSLGDFGALQPNERFTAAQKSAREWFEHLDAGGHRDVINVREACARYADWLERTGGKKGRKLDADGRRRKAKEARRRFAQYVDADPIATVELPKLRSSHVEAWRQRLESTPAQFERAGKGMGRGKGKGTRTRPRAPATVDRDMAPLRAALVHALEGGYVRSAVPWRKALEPSKARGQRSIYLTVEQRRALIKSLPDDVAAFAHALCVLPLRPGALAALTVGDFNPHEKTLRIGKDKAGEGRYLLLPQNALELVQAAARGKLPGAPLFARWDGKALRADVWGKAIKAAAAAAQLPEGVVAYSLRHAAITDLVTGGLDLLTVAMISGTSVAMIESNYGKLQQNRARDALAKLAL
jgi:integrase